jgi:hypothetical protein
MFVDLEKEIAELSNWRIVASGPNGFIRTCKTPAELRTWLRIAKRLGCEITDLTQVKGE